VMLALAFAALSRSNATHRLFAWFGIVQTLSAVVAFPVVTWLLAVYGWRGPFVAIALAGVGVLFAAIPAFDTMPRVQRLAFRDAQPAGLLSVFVFFTAQCAIWPFLERLGASRGVSDTLLGGGLSVGALCGFAGSAVIASLPSKLSGWGTWIAASVLNIAAIVALAISPSPATFIASLGAFNFAWAAFAPLQLHALKQLGASTATFALASTVTNAGFAVGPLVGGILLHQSGEAAALVAGIAGTPLAIAMLLPSRYSTKRITATNHSLRESSR
jgi:MFS transporter, DHA1 family, inner membrane transport protein